MQEHSNTPPRLSEILAGDGADLRKAWNATAPAADTTAPIPAGKYVTHLRSMSLHRAKTGTPGVKLSFEILEGAHAGRRLWLDLWLSPAAMPATKRDLAKLGITRLELVEAATRTGRMPAAKFRCSVKVALREGDDGTARNEIRGFDVLGLDDPPAADPFTPKPAPDATPPTPPEASAEAEGELFPFGHNTPDAADWGRA
jgi:hypothetical protein